MFPLSLNAGRWLPIAGFLVTLLALSENNSVYASCGDYLAHSGSQIRTEDFQSDVKHRSNPGQCRGPHCQSAPSTPITPTPHRIDDSRVDHLLMELFHSDLQCGSSKSLIYAGVVELPLPSARRLERPPRSGS